jgi:hypothetical protein
MNFPIEFLASALVDRCVDKTFVNDSKLAHSLRFCRIILLVPADVSIRVFSVPAHAWAVFPE